MNKPTKKLWRWALSLRRAIKSDAVFYFRAFLHKDTPSIAKIAMIAVIFYALSPIDIIPDLVFGLGIIDDVGIILLAAKYIKTLIPERVQMSINKKIIDADDLPSSKNKKCLWTRLFSLLAERKETKWRA